MNKKNRRLREVAAQAGVSFITAWRALNAPDLVADKTVAKVKAAADEIGYVANTVARSLVSAKSGVVGVIVPTLDDSIFADTVQGVSDALGETGTEILVGLSNYTSAREEELVRAFLGRQVDGLLLTGQDHTPGADKLLRQSAIPVVEMWDLPSDPIDMVVGFSNRDLAYQATTFLLQHGYKRIAFVTPAARSRGLERERGYRQCLADHGMEPVTDYVCRAAPTLDGGAMALQTMLDLERPPEAVFYNGDTMAIGAHLVCQAQSIKIPKTIALLGVHDLPIGAHIHPALSTVRVPRYQMGWRAAEALLRRLADPEFTIEEDLGFEIIPRATT